MNEIDCNECIDLFKALQVALIDYTDNNDVSVQEVLATLTTFTSVNIIPYAKSKKAIDQFLEDMRGVILTIWDDVKEMNELDDKSFKY